LQPCNRGLLSRYQRTKSRGRLSGKVVLQERLRLQVLAFRKPES
jgi:hypothetical protein